MTAVAAHVFREASRRTIKEIYKKLRPGEPPDKANAEALIKRLFLDTKRYDLAKVGRHMLNLKLNLKVENPENGMMNSRGKLYQLRINHLLMPATRRTLKKPQTGFAKKHRELEARSLLRSQWTKAVKLGFGTVNETSS